jgi:predicted metal-dependent phosphoesterase TrpH
LRESIARIHDQGGLAIPAHPLVPFPLCASEGAIRRLLADADASVRPDAIEAFNPTAAGRLWHPRVVEFARVVGLPQTGSSDAHSAASVGQAFTTFPGKTAAELRAAILTGEISWQGRFYGTRDLVEMLLRQLRKYGRDIRDELGGRLASERRGRDLGYPGGRRRPATFDERELRP